LLRSARNDDDVGGRAARGRNESNERSLQHSHRNDGRRAGPRPRRHHAVDGKIAGGDSYFYYTGSYTADRGKWRGELITNEHTKSAGVRPLFGGREVTCGFTGSYSADAADVNGTALVGKTSVAFHARLRVLSEL
jgi:hypothetical protein